MTDIAADARVRRDFPALAEAAAVVGSAQIRNRATLAGNLCNASPAADTAPALLVYGARSWRPGRPGDAADPVDDFFVRSGVTTLARGELVTAVELPIPAGAHGSVPPRRTRRRGHDLASVTLACAIDADGVTRIGYGSVGPRPSCSRSTTGVLADPARPTPRARGARDAVRRRHAVAHVDAGEPRVPAGDAPRPRAARGRGRDPAAGRGGRRMTRRRRSSSPSTGAARTVEVAPHHTLLDVLRDDLGLTGTKECCLVGECGACTVLVDGASVDACLVLGGRGRRLRR